LRKKQTDFKITFQVWMFNSDKKTLHKILKGEE
jgi:hypothetical protein